MGNRVNLGYAKSQGWYGVATTLAQYNYTTSNWCRNTLEGRWAHGEPTSSYYGTFYFENESDAFLFRLKVGHEILE